jgi:hypothetical protein
MSTLSVLSWDNENALTSYPLLADIVVQDFLVDANFVQFDNYQPKLLTIFVDIAKIVVTLQLDAGVLSATLFKADALVGQENWLTRIYTEGGGRYLGTLTFGPGINTLWELYNGRKFTINAPFDPNTVRSIPTTCGVYSFAGIHGAVTLGRTAEDATIFYNAATSKNGIGFNAVTGHMVSGSPRGLRKLNLVSPVNNNVNLQPNDVLKVSTETGRSLTLELVAGKSTETFNVTTFNA